MLFFWIGARNFRNSGGITGIFGIPGPLFFFLQSGLKVWSEGSNSPMWRKRLFVPAFCNFGGMIGFDPCKQESDNPGVVTVMKKSGNLMSFDEVLARYMSRPAPPLHEYHKMVVEAANYYSAAVVEESENCPFNTDALKKRLDELIVTEDAEVISIETVRPGERR